MKTLEELKSDARKIHDAIYEIEVASRREQNQKLIGKTFKHCSKHDGSTFSLVRWMDDQGYLFAFEIRVDCSGEVHVRPEASFYPQHYTPCPRSELVRAFKRLQKRLTDMLS